jgi:hypothetical protein
MIWGRRTGNEEGRRRGDLESIRARAGLTDISSKPEHLQSKELGDPVSFMFGVIRLVEPPHSPNKFDIVHPKTLTFE